MDTQKTRREIGKWIVGVFTCCVLIFLGIRHISSVASAVGFLANLFSPLLIGIVLALIFLIYIILLQQIENNFIYPKVVGSKINLPAMWVLAAVTVGGSLAGPIGMLLGVPAASSAYALLREATVRREAQKQRKPEKGIAHGRAE